ncbi:MAG: hypothetical protein HFI57_11275 [Lachnospiraceae bacterium]|nr:hypothetical protein [Lachnospiraceae bacterium]
MVTVNIFGSCVSRDVLEMQQERKIQLQNYIARESIVSALSPPAFLNMDQLNLDSNFQRTMVAHDFHKDVFELFRQKRSEILLIDFIEERFPLVKTGNSYVTYSNELMTSGYISKPELIRCCKKTPPFCRFRRSGGCRWMVGNINMDNIITEFGRRLLEMYNPEQIIIHEVYLSDQYMDHEKQVRLFPANHLENNQKLNEQYEYMYHMLEDFIPDARVINCSREYIADASHKWGLSPMHFQREYYEQVLEEIYRIIAII